MTNYQHIFLIPPATKNNEKPKWKKIGVAFENRDSSWNFRLQDNAPRVLAGLDLQLRRDADRVFRTDTADETWPQVGDGFRNRDGSKNVVLWSPLPAGTKLQLRPGRDRLFVISDNGSPWDQIATGRDNRDGSRTIEFDMAFLDELGDALVGFKLQLRAPRQRNKDTAGALGHARDEALSASGDIESTTHRTDPTPDTADSAGLTQVTPAQDTALTGGGVHTI